MNKSAALKPQNLPLCIDTICSGVQCPNNCNKNGKCVNGKCVCQAGFTGIDCSKGANKENKLSSDSSTGKQEASAQEQSKANNTIITKKDKGERQGRGPATVGKSPLNKDLPLSNNVTQSTVKKSNGTLKVLMKLAKSTKESANETVKTNPEKVKLSILSTVTSTKNDQKQSQDSVMKDPKGGTTVGEQKLEKHANATEEFKGKDQKKHKGDEKKVLERLLNITTSTEKDKKPIKESVTLFKEGSSGKTLVGKHSNVTTSTEKDRKPSQDSVTLFKEGSSEKTLVGKHSNVTTSTEKDRKPSQDSVTLFKEGSSEKTLVGKHSNVTTYRKPSQDSVTLFKEGSSEKTLVGKHSEVTTSIEKDKKPSQGNITQPKEGSSEKKMVEKLSNVTISINKDKTLRQSNHLPKDGSSGKRKVDKFQNATAANNKDIELLEDDETTPKKKATSGSKKGLTHVHVTASTEKDKKLNQGNVKHLNVTNFTEKDRKNQSKVIPRKEKIVGKRIECFFGQKRKKLGKETAQKLVNTMTSTGKDNKIHQGNVTLHKDESSRKTKLDSVITSTEKIKKLQQRNETKVLNDVTTEKERMEKYLNVTTFTDKDKKRYKSNTTLIKEGSSQKGKADNVNVKKSNEKGKKFLQGDETTAVTKVISVTEEKGVNATTTSEKGKSLHHSHKADASRLNKVNSDLKNSTIPKTHVDRTTKLTDIIPVEVHNITATGFVITWKAPLGLFRNFTVTRKEAWSERSSEDDAEEAEKRKGGDIKADEVLAGSARSYHFKNLRPQRKYSVSLISSGPHVQSKVHHLFVSTAPEPPTELLFSNITETSLTLSWTKPKSTVTGFKVTYTNSANGVTGSMSVDSQLSHVLISMLSVGSRYEISVRSVMGAIESEATTASVVTVPDSPTDLQAVNVTDSKALLVWKPAQAKVDHYILSYGSTRSPNVTVTVMLSGTSVEHQLRGLQRYTLYAVKIMSQINSLQSSSVSTTFTTKSGVTFQVVTPSKVTWNSALILWKTTPLTFRSYRLTYQFGEEIKEVILSPNVTQYELTDLVASSHYTVKVDGEIEGQYISVVSTGFTTAQLPYPYPAECSKVQLNGMKKSGEAEIYPEGKDGEAVWVYCDMETDGGGWTVFQRRADGSTDFFRDWKDYSKGFGEMSAEFWLGNDVLHALTSMEPMSLRIDLRLGNETAYAHYSNFSVGSEVNHYTIELSGYSGTAGDSLKYHSGSPFSTKDKEPSTNSGHCTKKYMGGWWYKNCYKANLNGAYAKFSMDQGVVWIDWKGKDVSLPFTEMKLRPASLSYVTPNTQG
ncbi:tenascin-R [Ictalurus furcatus]|uniref:tenascin-R n=1 Tax=Ictalurus furcatus TaxID=66913 RepID=UPI00235051B5|nr:tenascin-R [Ictalurus furcatus]